MKLDDIKESIGEVVLCFGPSGYQHGTLNLNIDTSREFPTTGHTINKTSYELSLDESVCGILRDDYGFVDIDLSHEPSYPEDENVQIEVESGITWITIQLPPLTTSATSEKSTDVHFDEPVFRAVSAPGQLEKTLSLQARMLAAVVVRSTIIRQ